MITLTTVGNPKKKFSIYFYNFAFTANFVILTIECTKLSEHMTLLCKNGYKGMSLDTIG